MRKTEWIMSQGGPLVCIEKRLEHTWGGMDELTVATAEVANDYERACKASEYLERIQVRNGSALVVGDAPLDTAFWQSDEGEVFVVRVWHCEEGLDVDALMKPQNPASSICRSNP